MGNLAKHQFVFMSEAKSEFRLYNLCRSCQYKLLTNRAMHVNNIIPGLSEAKVFEYLNCASLLVNMNSKGLQFDVKTEICAMTITAKISAVCIIKNGKRCIWPAMSTFHTASAFRLTRIHLLMCSTHGSWSSSGRQADGGSHEVTQGDENCCKLLRPVTSIIIVTLQLRISPCNRLQDLG